MNKQPSLQAAVVTGLNILNDPEVRIPAAQAEGLVSLRLLLQGLASGQLVITEAQPAATPVAGATARRPRVPRKAKTNGADVGAAPPSVQ